MRGGLSLGWLEKNEQLEENKIDETYPDIKKMADIEEEEATSAAPLVDVDEIINAFIQDVDSIEEATDNESIYASTSYMLLHRTG